MVEMCSSCGYYVQTSANRDVQQRESSRVLQPLKSLLFRSSCETESWANSWVSVHLWEMLWMPSSHEHQRRKRRLSPMAQLPLTFGDGFQKHFMRVQLETVRGRFNRPQLWPQLDQICDCLCAGNDETNCNIIKKDNLTQLLLVQQQAALVQEFLMKPTNLYIYVLFLFIVFGNQDWNLPFFHWF